VSTLSHRTLLTLVACISLADRLYAEEPKHARNDKNVLARFEIAKDGDWLLLPVKCKGKTYQFFLDTCATYNVFDSSLSLGDPIGKMGITGAAGWTILTTHDAPQATLRGLSLKTDDPALAFNFTKVRHVTGYEVYGIIGMPFLSRTVLRVDFD
jgi:hypothetical protein